MRAIQIGASWCRPPSEAVVGQQWTCPECGEHWTALQGHVLPVNPQTGDLGESEAYAIWEQTWAIEARQDADWDRTRAQAHEERFMGDPDYGQEA